MSVKQEVRHDRSIKTLKAIKQLLENLSETVTENINNPSLISPGLASLIKSYALDLRTASDRLERNISDERLKECPFCRHDASLLLCDGGDYGDDYYEVECDFCGCSMSFASNVTEEEAIKTWNTRGYHEQRSTSRKDK